MTSKANYMALPFMQSHEKGRLIAGDAKAARSAESAIRMAGLLAVLDDYCGAIAYSRAAGPALDKAASGEILRSFGKVDVGLVKA